MHLLLSDNLILQSPILISKVLQFLVKGLYFLINLVLLVLNEFILIYSYLGFIINFVLDIVERFYFVCQVLHFILQVVYVDFHFQFKLHMMVLGKWKTYLDVSTDVTFKLLNDVLVNGNLCSDFIFVLFKGVSA
jgi:hypothetical protein